MYIVHKLNVHNYFIEAGLSDWKFYCKQIYPIKNDLYPCNCFIRDILFMSLVSFKSKFHTMRNVFSIMCSIQNYTTE